jgi:hypothetical protein
MIITVLYYNLVTLRNSSDVLCGKFLMHSHKSKSNNTSGKVSHKMENTSMLYGVVYYCVLPVSGSLRPVNHKRNLISVDC